MNPTLILGDCLEVLPTLPDGVADMVLADLPYGTTACRWDSVLPLEELWREMQRVAKANAAFIFTATQPFSSTLLYSWPKGYRYSWYYQKSRPTGFANAKRQPLRCIEEVLVFYSKSPTYNPQGLVKVDRPMYNTAHTRGGDALRGDTTATAGRGALRTKGHTFVQEFTNYPRQLLAFPSGGKTIHPTQKPVALFEYLIRTYTNEGDIVLDPCAGVLTTAVACANSGRHAICIERDAGYF